MTDPTPKKMKYPLDGPGCLECLTEKKELLAALEAMVNAHTRGDPHKVMGSDSNDGHPLNAMGLATQNARALIAKHGVKP